MESHLPAALHSAQAGKKHSLELLRSRRCAAGPRRQERRFEMQGVMLQKHIGFNATLSCISTFQILVHGHHEKSGLSLTRPFHENHKATIGHGCSALVMPSDPVWNPR